MKFVVETVTETKHYGLVHPTESTTLMSFANLPYLPINIKKLLTAIPLILTISRLQSWAKDIIRKHRSALVLLLSPTMVKGKGAKNTHVTGIKYLL